MYASCHLNVYLKQALDEKPLTTSASIRAKLAMQSTNPLAHERSIPASDTRDHYTLCVAASAAGTMYPPLLVMPGASLPILTDTTTGQPFPLPQEFVYAVQKSGNMDAACMVEYLKVLKRIRKDDFTILTMDNAAVHKTDEVMELLRSFGWFVVWTPPNSTCTTSALDVGVMGPIQVCNMRIIIREIHGTCLNISTVHVAGDHIRLKPTNLPHSVTDTTR